MSVSNLEKLRLTLTTQGYEYDIYPIQSVDPTQRKNATSISVPGQAPKNNVLLGISGMEEDITISFTIYDDGSDRANSADTGYGSTVVTVEEQITYLRDVMHEPSFSAKWELDHLTGSVYSARPVFFEEFSTTPISNNSPKWKSATIRLRTGSSA